MLKTFEAGPARDLWSLWAGGKDDGHGWKDGEDCGEGLPPMLALSQVLWIACGGGEGGSSASHSRRELVGRPRLAPQSDMRVRLKSCFADASRPGSAVDSAAGSSSPPPIVSCTADRMGAVSGVRQGACTGRVCEQLCAHVWGLK